MPIESPLIPCASASLRSCRKYGRDWLASESQGGIVISPASRRFGADRTASRTASSDKGSIPAFESSWLSFTSRKTSRPDPNRSSRCASLTVSTVWTAENSPAARLALLLCSLPIRWNRAPRQVGQHGGLRLELLNVVLPEIPLAGLECRDDVLRRLSFRYSNERDAVRIAPGLPGSGRDPVPNRVQAIRNRRQGLGSAHILSLRLRARNRKAPLPGPRAGWLYEITSSITCPCTSVRRRSMPL